MSEKSWYREFRKTVPAPVSFETVAASGCDAFMFAPCDPTSPRSRGLLVTILPPELFHRLPAAQPRELVAMIADICFDPCRICVGVVAQYPSDHLSDKELLFVCKFENGRGQKGRVGLFLVLQMSQQRGAANPALFSPRPQMSAGCSLPAIALYFFSIFTL